MRKTRQGAYSSIVALWRGCLLSILLVALQLVLKVWPQRSPESGDRFLDVSVGMLKRIPRNYSSYSFSCLYRVFGKCAGLGSSDGCSVPLPIGIELVI